jgi:hypothetical protein
MWMSLIVIVVRIRSPAFTTPLLLGIDGNHSARCAGSTTSPGTNVMNVEVSLTMCAVEDHLRRVDRGDSGRGRGSCQRRAGSRAGRRGRSRGRRLLVVVLVFVVGLDPL